MQKYRIAIVGGGVAGLRAAIEAYDLGVRDIIIISKTHPIRSNSVGAQGGMAAALTPEAVRRHIEDTIKGSDNLAERKAVEFISKHSREAVEDLERMGCIFARDAKRMLLQKQLAGHSQKIACYVADRTGHAILTTLYEQVLKRGITVLEDAYAVNLITTKKECKGVIVYLLKTGKIRAIKTKAVLLATGGAGQLFKTTSNSALTTGDGFLLAFGNGIALQNMELIQFHPTGLKEKGILISEAARSAGAKLLNEKHQRFMLKHPEGEMAPRDITSREIRGQKKAFLDFRDVRDVKTRLPEIAEIVEAFTTSDITKDLIWIEPTAHYMMGGIPINLNAEVEDMKGLYAAGECAYSGMHGANRLGGNSLLEAMVIGKQAGRKMAREAKRRWFYPPVSSSEIERAGRLFLEFITNLKKGSGRTASELENELREIMSERCGVVRNEKGLLNGLKRLKKLKEELENTCLKDSSLIYNQEMIRAWELRQMIALGEIVMHSALERKTSIGAHYRDDREGEHKKFHLIACQKGRGIIIKTKK